MSMQNEAATLTDKIIDNTKGLPLEYLELLLAIAKAMGDTKAHLDKADDNCHEMDSRC